jgi:putative ABC transport system permease protein
MIRYIWRQIMTRPGRAGLTLLSIVIGVAAVVSVTSATTSARKAYDAMYGSLTGRSDLEIVAEGGGVLDERIATELASIPGIKCAVPVLLQPTVAYLGAQRATLVLVGIDLAGLESIHNYRLASGRLPNAEREIMLESQFARGAKLEIGQELKILARRGVKRLTIVGLLAPSNAAASNPAVALFSRLADAQALFGRRGEVHAVQLVLTEQANPAQVQREVASRLPDDLRVRKPAARSELPRETMRAAELGLFFASALAIEVAMIIILNTFMMNVSERRRQLAVLRTIGATRRQIMTALLGEGLGMGIVGSLIGLPVGLGGGYFLSSAVQMLLQVELPAMQVSASALVAAMLTGPSVALIGTLVPAWQASRVVPLEALRALDTGPEKTRTRFAGLTAVTLFAMSAGIFVACRLGYFPPLVVIASGAIAIVGCVFLLSSLLGPIVRSIGLILAKIGGVEGWLACEQLLRRRGRCSLTVGVLFVALSTSLGVANTLWNDIHDARTWFRRTMVADYFVRVTFADPSAGTAPAMPESLADEIRKLPGVVDVESVRFVSAQADQQPMMVIVRDFSRAQRVPLNLEAGSSDDVRQRLLDSEIVIGTALAERLHRHTGERIVLDTPEGPRSLRIAGVVNEYLVGGLIVGMDRAVARKLLHVEGADAFMIHADPPLIQQTRPALEAWCREHSLLLQSYGEFGRLVDDMLAGVMGSLWVLLGLAMTVAAFGIVNTLSMNVLEQTREIGLLRIVAMTRSQVRKTILWQAGVMGLIGLLPGALAGVGAAWLINRTTVFILGHRVEFVVYPSLVVTAFAAAMVVVLAAALVPAQRAAHMQLAAAIQQE